MILTLKLPKFGWGLITASLLACFALNVMALLLWKPLIIGAALVTGTLWTMIVAGIAFSGFLSHES